MTRTNNWTDEDWLLLLQLYLRKPVGLKPPYSRPVVDLALELHVPPGELFARMCSVANLETPLLERMWQKYGATAPAGPRGGPVAQHEGLRQCRGLLQWRGRLPDL